MADAITREERAALLSDKPMPERMYELSFGLDLPVSRVVALCYEAALAASEAEVERLREALRPFAEITPSSGVAPDGLDNEPYQVFLGELYR